MPITLKIWLNLALAGLQSAVKNPKSLAKELSVLVQVRDVLNQLIAGINAQ